MSLRCEMVQPKKIEIAVIERGVQRVAEVDVSIAPDHDVVRRVETFAFKLIGDHLNPAVTSGAGDAPGTIFTCVQASLAVHGIAVGAVRSLAVYFGALAGNILINTVR